MTKSYAMWGAIILVVIAAVVFALNSGGSASMQKDAASDAMMKDGVSGEAMVKDDAAMMKDGAKAGDVMMKDDSMNNGDATKDSGAMMKDDSAMMKGDAMKKMGSYEAYAPEKLALASSGDVLIFFHAPWCPICQALEKEITANPTGIPAGLTILKVDFDTATSLRKKYGVTLQHTFVQVQADGSAIQKWSDSSTLASVVKKVQ